MKCHIPVSDTQAVPPAPHQFLACNKTQYGKLGNKNYVIYFKRISTAQFNLHRWLLITELDYDLYKLRSMTGLDKEMNSFNGDSKNGSKTRMINISKKMKIST